MSTNVPPLTLALKSTFLEKLSSHIKLHHTLIKAILAIALIWGISGKIQKSWANHEQHVFDKSSAELQVKEQAASDAAKQASVQAAANVQLAAQYAALVKKVDTENAVLEKANEDLRGQLKNQQAIDTTLPLEDLSKRWQTLASLQPADVTAGEGIVTVSPAGAHATVSALENVPVLTQELKNSQDTVQNNVSQITSANTLAAGLNSQVADLNKQVTALQAKNVASDKTCDAKVAEVKAKNKSAMRTAFKRGLEIGAIAGGAVVGYLLHKF